MPNGINTRLKSIIHQCTIEEGRNPPLPLGVKTLTRSSRVTLSLPLFLANSIVKQITKIFKQPTVNSAKESNSRTRTRECIYKQMRKASNGDKNLQRDLISSHLSSHILQAFPLTAPSIATFLHSPLTETNGSLSM